MAILAIFTGKGITIDHYEQLRREVGWERQHPPGAMFHAASFDSAGDLHVVDVWASPGEMEQFMTERLQPALKRLGLAEPTVEVYPTHNINAYPTLHGHHLSRH